MLTSVQNPLVKQIRKLHQSKGRREQQLFLLEGTHLLEEACNTDYPLVNVFCTPEWQEKHLSLWNLICQKAKQTELVTDRVLKALSTTVNPDGIVATALPAQTNKVKITSLGVALEKLQDPGNFGTIIRTATAVGVDGIWLSRDSVDLYHPKVVRASAGVWFRLPMAITQDLKSEVEQLQNQGVQIVATVPDASINYWEIDLRKPTLILLGNEGGGLSHDLLSLANYSAKIPLSNGVESLNVAISSALILYEARRQRQTQEKKL
ncbi:MAG: RNA methyltransferase [Microcoleaceae cyanobacterium MO_207.B10]|nr:RNA methyltransferase [Microcoleaceae cyanobacterium MO_207.B10]